MGAVLLIVIALLVWVFLQLRPMLGQAHMRRLERFHSSLAADRRKVVVCMGDSLTQGNASYDYVHELARRLEPSGYTLLNAGINGELAWNLLQRIDAVVRCEPAYVVVLVGTNDALACESEWAAANYVRRMKLPQLPNEDFFRQSYSALLDALDEAECTRAIVVTLPPLGERPGEPIDAIVARQNAFIEEQASSRGGACLPLHRGLEDVLARDDRDDRPKFDARASRRLILKAIFCRYLLSWRDRIAEHNGMTLLTDMVHLNERGGRILVDVVEAEIKGQPARYDLYVSIRSDELAEASHQVLELAEEAIDDAAAHYVQDLAEIPDLFRGRRIEAVHVLRTVRLHIPDQRVQVVALVAGRDQ